MRIESLLIALPTLSVVTFVSSAVSSTSLHQHLAPLVYDSDGPRTRLGRWSMREGLRMQERELECRGPRCCADRLLDPSSGSAAITDSHIIEAGIAKPG